MKKLSKLTKRFGLNKEKRRYKQMLKDEEKYRI